MYELTIFKSQYDNKTHRVQRFETWDDFCALLDQLAEVPRQGKKDAPLISPAIYKQGATRANRNLDYWGSWCAMDIDDAEFNPETLQHDIIRLLPDSNFYCYSTASSTVDKPKFRIAIDLGSPLSGSDTRHFWFALQCKINRIGDEQTKDGSRMYYVPAKYVGAYNFTFRHSGDHLSAKSLMDQYEYIEKSATNFMDNLPEEMQKALVEYRKSKLENTDITWTSYRDCPFFPKKLAAKYQTLTDTGWYHTMYCIMVAIAGNAINKGYPITAYQIAELCRDFDRDNGNWYEKRPMDVEANSALEYAYRNNSWG